MLEIVLHVTYAAFYERIIVIADTSLPFPEHTEPQHQNISSIHDIVEHTFLAQEDHFACTNVIFLPPDIVLDSDMLYSGPKSNLHLPTILWFAAEKDSCTGCCLSTNMPPCQ